MIRDQKKPAFKGKPVAKSIREDVKGYFLT